MKRSLTSPRDITENGTGIVAMCKYVCGSVNEQKIVTIVLVVYGKGEEGRNIMLHGCMCKAAWASGALL